MATDWNLFTPVNQKKAGEKPAEKPATDWSQFTPIEKPGILRGLGDTAVSVGRGVASGIESLANVAGADNAVARGAGKASDFIGGLEGEYRQAERLTDAVNIQEAEKSGSTANEVGAYLKSFANAPIDTSVEALGSIVPTAAAAYATRGKVAPVVTGGAVGAAQGVGESKGQIYDEVKQRGIEAGLSDADADAQAQEAQAYGGKNSGQLAIAGGLGALAGSSGIEGAVSRLSRGAAVAEGSILKRAAVGAAGEAIPEAAQAGHQQFAANLAQQNAGYEQPLMEGVAGQAALGAAASILPGAAFNLPNPVTVDPNAGAISKALAQHPSATQPVVQPAAGLIPPPAMDAAPVMDAATGQANYAKVVERSDPMALDKAQSIADSMNASASGMDGYTVAPHGNAGFTVVPTAWLTDEQLTSFASIQGEGGRLPAPAPGEAAPIRIDDSGNAMVETPEQAAEIAALKQRFIDMGKPTPRGVNPNDAIQKAAAKAPAPAIQPQAVIETPGPRGIVENAPGPRGIVETAQPGKSAAAPAALTANKSEDIAGEKIDKKWTEFDQASGTLGIDRAQMPQIKSEHRGAMVNFLNARGITSEQGTVLPTDLKATQREFSPGKVEKAKGFTGNDRSILVSSDGHVLDGHHQWIAKRESGQPVKVIRLNAPILELLAAVAEFPSAQTAAGATAQAQPNAAPSATPAQGVAEAKSPASAPVIARVGTTPNSADPVTVRAGVVHIGEYPAQDFETGENITVPDGSTFEQVSDALRQGRALSNKQRIYAGEKGMRQPKATGKESLPVGNTAQDRAPAVNDGQRTVEVDGDTWRILSTGATREDGKTYAHLASTTRFRQQKNGPNPIQMMDWIDLAGTQDVAPAVRATGTAPEHAAVGVDDRELGEIVDEFNAAQARATSDPEAVTHVFDAPAKGDIVRLADKAKVYHKDHGWMTVEEAKAKIAEWKDKARSQGGAEAYNNGNAQRIVLSLFDLTGSWSKPWEEAGYQVFRFDIQDDPNMGNVNKFDSEFFNDNFGAFEGQDIYAVLAACPCTDFAVSGARHFAAKDADGRTVASVKLVHQTMNVVEYFKPAVWAIENPVGRIEKLGGLPPWRLSFDPNHLGDPYTKKTLLWGRFNGDLPVAPVEPTEGSKMHRLYGGKSMATKNARSATPEGFAYGFFAANNAVDHPVMAIANKYDRLDRKIIKKAVDAGVTEAQISDAVDDFYYMDLDDAAANDAIRGLIPAPGGDKKPDPAESQDQKSPQQAMHDGMLAAGWTKHSHGHPRRYTTEGGSSYLTWEKDGARIATSGGSLYTDRGSVMLDDGAPTDVTIQALLVDKGVRRQGKAGEALQEIAGLANKRGITLYIQPEQLESDGPTRGQLAGLYERHGFSKQDDSGRVLVRKPSTANATKEPKSVGVNGRQDGWRTNAIKARKVMKDLGIERADGMKLADMVAAIDAHDAEQAADGQNDELDAEMRGYEAKAGADEAKEKTGTVSIPGPISEALQYTMQRQKEKIGRARAKLNKPMALAEKTALHAEISQLEAGLRKMRTSIFDAEDAIAEAIKSGDVDPFKAFDDLFPRAASVLGEHIADAGETKQPTTLDELVGAVDAGYKAHFDYAGVDGRTVWIEKTDRGWVMKSRNDGSNTTITKGGGGPAGGWAKYEALNAVERDAKHRFTEWKPLADEAPTPVVMPTTDDDLGAMFDEVLAEETAPKQAKAAPKPRNPSTAPAKPRAPRAPRTAGEAAGSAAKNAAAGLGDAIDGLGKLFGGGGRLSSGLSFDEDTYAQAKPLFVSAVSHLQASGQDLKDMMRAIVRMVLDKFGQGAAENMKPYVVRFMTDVRDGKVAYDEATGQGDENGQADTGEQGPQALDGVAAGENGATEGGTKVRGSRAGRRAGGKPDDRGLDEPRVSGTRSGGSGSTSVRAPGSGRKRKAGSSGAGGTGGDGNAVSQGNEGLERPVEAVSAANIQAINFRITDDVRLGQGGEAEKFRDNIAAIKAIKAIESENRRATGAEQRILARYVGWGGLANAFPNPETKQFKPEWEARGRELESLLTPKEYALARRSTLDSHYTSQTIVSAMWDAARHLGFKGGLVAETSMGAGNFLGLVPDDLQGRAKFIGVEYDSLTARLAGLLYPQETVLNSGIQDVPLPDGAFDLNIGNPPFGDQSLRFQYKPEFNGVSIHNQFFLAGVDALKPGGIQINVVSRYLLDSMDKSARTMLAKRAKLLGAIRLPDTAFQENARTSVVTDIVVLQRLTPAEQAEMEAAFDAAKQKPDTKNHANETARRALAEKVPDWVETAKVSDPLGGDAMTVSSYFASNPDMILGTLERSGKMQFKNDITVRPDDADLSALLARAVAKLPQDVMAQEQSAIEASLARHQSMSDALRIAISGQETGSIVIDQDGVMQQVFERETPEGGFELAKRPITEKSPWSESLMQNDSGKWFKLEVAIDAEGKPVKQIKNGKATKLNVYTRTIYQSESDIPATMLLGSEKYKRLRKLVELRDLMVEQINLETEDAPSAKMEANRAKLAGAYRAFVAEEGYISRQANSSLVNNMPDGALVQALELSYRPEIDAAKSAKTGEPARKEYAEPAPIMSGRVIPKYEPATSAASPSDALAITLSESGRVDIARMAQLLGKSEDEVVAEMHDEADRPLIFKDPEANAWVTRSEYLTGQVKRKLHAAQAARLPKNVAELEAVQPEPWGAEDVTALLGSTWVPPEVYAEFAEHVTGRSAKVRFSQATNSFSVNTERATQEKLDEFGAEGISIGEMLSHMLNSTSIRVTTTDSEGKTHLDEERTKLALLKAKVIANEFADWVFADSARRNQLVGIFNEQFNTRVARQHDGSHLTLPGKVPDTILKMRRHQKNTIWRGISERFMLIDHVVGAGKTFTAIARAMERRRMGLSKKPAIIVPNHMVEQFAADIYRLYPGAKVLAAGKKDFEKIRRRRLFAKIASGDWDIVIIPHSSFGFIGISPETEARYLENELRIAEQAIKDAWDQAAEDGEDTGRRKPFNVKQAERLAERITMRMDAVKGRAKKDKLLTFEQMGIDDLTVDEAHEFKNLFYSSRLTKVKGMGNSIGSHKAFDLYNKVRVLRDSPSGTVTFMTGTPISNSAVEMYTMMRYLAADELRELGMEHFDAWRAQYVSTDPGWEPNETGRLTEVNRLGRSWSNMRSLMDLYYSFTDSVGNDQIKQAYSEDNNGKEFPIPKVMGGDRRLVMSDPTPEQLGMLNETIKEFDDLPGIKDPYERNIARLRLMDRARKLSLDVRAAIPGHPSKEVGGKLDKISDEAVRLYRKWDADKGTQLVFLDRSVPKSKGDDKIIKEYEKLVAERDAALASNNDEELSRVLEALDKYDTNEIEELRAAQRGGWNAYQQIKDNLIARGIPANEIRFIQEANNDAQKQALFDAVKAGQVRVLIGSTPRMGAGTNVQDRLVGLHHADVTWKPSDIEQREGRIIRQGNKFATPPEPGKPNQLYREDFEVEILAYATERTIDAKMWSLNSAKLKTINGIRKYDGSFSMDFEDADSVGMAEIAALASGDPLLLERVKLTSEIDSLELLERQHRRKMWGYTSRVEEAEKDIEVAPARNKRMAEVAEILKKGEESLQKHFDARTVTVEGKVYSSYKEAAAAINGHIAEQQAGDEEAKVAVRVGERRLTSKNGALEALHDALGDTGIPFLLQYDGQDIIGRTEAGRTLNKRLAQIVADLGKRDSKIVDFGTMLGLKLEVMIERNDGDRYITNIAAIAENGQTVQAIDLDSEKAAPVTSAIGNALSKLGDMLKSGPYERAAQNALQAAERAKVELPKLREQAAAPFARAEELSEKRKRLQEITAQLAADNKPASAANDDTAFSRTDGLTDRQAVQRVVRVQRVVDGIKAKWNNAPEIIVVSDMQDPQVPKRVRDLDAEMKSNGSTGEPRGFISAGKVYIVAGQHKSVEDVVTTVAHEVLGHAGLRGMYGEALNPILRQIVNMRRAEVNAKVKEYGFDPRSERDLMRAAEEVLANMAQTQPEVGFVKRAIAAIRQWLRSVGVKMALSDNDIIASFILPARAFIENGRGPGGGKRDEAFSRSNQTDSEAFKKWFGDSKVVDSDGKPLVVYHGTPREFVGDKFVRGKAFRGNGSLGFHFGSVAAANDRVAPAVERAKNFSWADDRPSLIPVHLRINRPLKMRDIGAWHDPDWVAVGLHESLGYGQPKLDEIQAGAKTKQGRLTKIQEHLESIGYDGIVYENTHEDAGSASYIVFRSTQIKSAIGNNGSFDPANADIMFSRTVEIGAAVSQRAADLLTTQKTFNNWWHKTVGTQYHKAQIDKDFRPAFNAVQSYLQGTATFANSAADLADRLIPQLNSIRDLWNKKQPSQDDIKAVSGPIFAGTLEDERVYDATELRSRFKLTDAQIDLYVQFRAAVDKSLDDLGKTDILRYAGAAVADMRDEVMAASTASRAAIMVAARLNQSGNADDAKVVMDKGMRVADLKAKGYAPLTRFGRYTLYVTEGDEQLYFSLFESEAEANAMARQMKEAHPRATVSQGVLSSESYKLFNGISPDTLELFAGALGAENNEVVQEYIKLAKSNRSAMKRLLKRKGIAGFSDDVPRILASFITSNARQSSANVYGGLMDKAAEAIPKEKGDVKDEAIKMIEFARNPVEDAAKLRGLLFVQYIGGSVASAVVNMTQPLTMSLPYLHQFSKRAPAELAKAMKHAAIGGELDPDLKKALKRAEIDGVVSPQEIHQLQAEAVKKGAGIGALARMFGVKGDTANRLDDWSKRGLFVWGSMFSMAEQFNRRATFIAAYNIARQTGEADPFAFAEKAVVETQGIYNRGNRPDWARGAVGATLFTFKQYSISYMEFLKRLPPKERAIALAILLLAAGLNGVPFADDLDDLADTLAQQMGYSWNSKAEKQKFMASILGQTGADFALHGTSALPGIPLDFAARLGMSNLLPGTGILLKNKTDKAGEVFEVLGPAGGVMKDALRGEFMPIAVRNMLKAADMAQTGMYRDYAGKKVIESDGVDAAMKLIGFNPAKVAREGRAARMDMQDVQLARNVESEIAEKMAQGVFSQDKDAVAEAREMLADWNRKNPDKPIVITSRQIMQRVKQMQMTRRERLIKSAPKELRGGLVD